MEITHQSVRKRLADGIFVHAYNAAMTPCLRVSLALKLFSCYRVCALQRRIDFSRYLPRQAADMPRVIISYRRADSAAMAGRIRDRLAGTYGPAAVFMDVEDIPFGIDFRDHIRNELLRSDALIVVVGHEWLGQGQGGAARIRSETDPVRIEVETALTGGITVVPVLVNGAHMPEPDELPESLTKFAYLNAAIVDAGRDFHQHVDRLIHGINAIAAAKKSSVSTTRAGQPGRGRLYAAIAAGCGVVVVAIAGVTASGWLATGSSSAPTVMTLQSMPETTSAVRSVTVASAADRNSAEPAPRMATLQPPAAALAGTYLAQSKPGCGTSSQSVRVSIRDGQISWEHDALNRSFQWQGTIDPAGFIRASVADTPSATASGRYFSDEHEITMTYPQCGTVTMLIGQMLRR